MRPTIASAGLFCCWLALGGAIALAADETSWDDEGIADSNLYEVPRQQAFRQPGRSTVEATVSRAPKIGADVPYRPWYHLPPPTFAQRDLLGSELFFGSRPLNFGQAYGTGFGPSYFGNFGNGYGTGESRSYFGNYGIGYGLGESRKY